MATGESYASLSFAYRISARHISPIVKEVLRCLRNKLVPQLMPEPTQREFQRISNEFWIKWNFPNAVGANLFQLQSFLFYRSFSHRGR